ncbi:hypothetical protein L7F22_023076 [Adiantum nelumboides]|nr:hypothetical protein [Adiantum nelumboides]
MGKEWEEALNKTMTQVKKEADKALNMEVRKFTDKLKDMEDHIKALEEKNKGLENRVLDLTEENGFWRTEHAAIQRNLEDELGKLRSQMAEAKSAQEEGEIPHIEECMEKMKEDLKTELQDTKSGWIENVDRRYYNQLLYAVPTSFVDVPVLLHCLLEQVAVNSICSTELKEKLVKDEEREVHDYLRKKFSKLGRIMERSLPDNVRGDHVSKGTINTSACEGDRSTRRELPFQSDSEFIFSRENMHVMHEFDTVEKNNVLLMEEQTANLHKRTLIDVAEVAKHMASLGCIPGRHRQGMPTKPILSKAEKGALASKVHSDGRYSHSFVQIQSKLKELKAALLTADYSNNASEALQLENVLQSLQQFKYMELYPDSLVSEVYSEAKLTRPFEKLIYDDMEDCIICVLYAADGMYNFTYSIPCQIPFGDFCNKHQDLTSFTAAPRSYEIEEHKSHSIENRYCYLLPCGSFFSCGLPSAVEPGREPQGTLHVDGSTYILRSNKSGNKTILELTACFKDGLIACFFPVENGSINLQLSNLDGSIIEMSCDGVLHMSTGSYTNNQSDITHEQLSDLEHKQNDCTNSITNFGDFSICLAKEDAEGDIWRCILPSGTVLCGKKSREIVALFRNGNISCYKRTKPDCYRWITVNSLGYHVLQEPLEASHLHQNVNQSETVLKAEGNIQDDTKVSSITTKDTKLAKKDDSGELPPSKSTQGKKKKVVTELEGVKNNDTPQENESKITTNILANKVVNALEKDCPRIVADDPTKPFLYVLPKKRIVQIIDRQTNCHIESREDLVTVVKTPEENCIAQHSDGTQMYTRRSRCQTSAVCTNSDCTKDSSTQDISSSKKGESISGQLITGKESEDMQDCLNETSIVKPCNIKENVVNFTAMSPNIHRFSSGADWQIQNEKYPTVWSEGDKIYVNINTLQNLYVLSYCKTTGTLHLLLPSGQCMYTLGNSVFLDCLSTNDNVSRSDDPAKEVEGLEAWERHNIDSKSFAQPQHTKTKGFFTFNLLITQYTCSFSVLSSPVVSGLTKGPVGLHQVVGSSFLFAGFRSPFLSVDLGVFWHQVHLENQQLQLSTSSDSNINRGSRPQNIHLDASDQP